MDVSIYGEEMQNWDIFSALWAVDTVSDPYLTILAITQDLGFHSHIRRTALLSLHLRQASATEDLF